MTKVTLPFSRTETQFWQAIADRLVKAPGLILAVVPRDLNTVAARQHLRQVLCHSQESDHGWHDIAPHGRQVAGVDVSCDGAVTPLPGAELLPRALATLDIDADWQEDLVEDERLFVLISGISIPQGTSISQWVREIIPHWPGGQPSNATNPLHCCCIVSTEQPLGQAPLPEGCDWLAVDAASDEEIRNIARRAVDNFWHTEEPCVRQYLCSGIADMASGQRVHAEHALEILQEEWQDGLAHQQDWRPMWRSNSRLVEQVSATMHALGLDSDWARTHLTQGMIGQYREDSLMAQRLWEHGLWRSIGENTSLWQGMTMVARASIQTANAPGWLMQPPVPDATAQVLVQALRVENQLRYHLLRLMQSPKTRAAVDRVLDELQRNEGGTQRQRILDDLERTPGSWDRRWPYIPPERRCDADVLISVCSFGTLSRIVNQLLPRERYRHWSASLKNIVDARNVAAHGGWFALTEFRAFTQDTSRVEADLASLRFI